MEKAAPTKPHSSPEANDLSDFDQLLETLPKVRMPNGSLLYQYMGCWCPSNYIKSIGSFGQRYTHHDKDLIISSVPKAGTTWMKALVYSIVNRSQYTTDRSPLLHTNPHQLMPCIEHMPGDVDLNTLPSPRLFATHLPYTALPESVLRSGCRILHVARNPLDQFVSYWHFIKETGLETYWNFIEEHGLDTGDRLPLDEVIDWYFKGLFQPCGPFLDNMLRYWNASKENPTKVKFLKYEDLKADTCRWVKEIGEFAGFPFSKEEDEMGLRKDIVKLCSFENLKNLDVNKEGVVGPETNPIRNSSFFRKGQVGDWANFLPLSGATRFQNLIEEKLGDRGLKF